MKLSSYLFLSCLFCISFFSSCDKDDEDELKESVVEKGSGSMNLMTPQEQEAYIAETAAMFVGSFNQETIGLLALNATFFAENYGSLQAPEQWRRIGEKLLETAGNNIDIKDLLPTDPAQWLKELLAGAVSGDAARMTRASFNIINNYKFSDLTGVYVPGDGEWIRQGDSSNIEFRFSGPAGIPQKITVSESGKPFVYSYTVEKHENGDIYYTTTALYIPGEVKAVYSIAGVSVAETDVTLTVNEKEDGTMDISASVSAKAGDIAAALNLKMTNRLITGTYTLDSQGKRVSNGAFEAEGDHLTDVMHIFMLKSQEEVLLLIDEAEAFADILGRIQINTEIDMSKQLFGLPMILDNLNGGTKDEAVKIIEKSAKVLNDKTHTWLRYDGTATEQAWLKWSHILDEKDGLWACSLAPMVYFPADKTEIPLTKFAESLLGSLSSSPISLIRDSKFIFGLRRNR